MLNMRKYDVSKKAAAKLPNHFKAPLPIKKYFQQKQRRFLNPEDTLRLIKALEEEEREAKNPWASYAIHLSLMTGCRLNEIWMLKWEGIDFPNKIWRFSYSNTGRKLIYLSPRALDLLKRIPKQKGNAYVMGQAKLDVMNLQRLWQRVGAKVGLYDVRLHHLSHIVLSFVNEQGSVR